MKDQNKQWEPWIKLANYIEDRGVLSPVWDWFNEVAPVGDPLRHLVGAALSVAKWHPANSRRGGQSLCGLCYARCMNREDLYWNMDCVCERCPMDCLERGSNFLRWLGMFHIGHQDESLDDAMFEQVFKIYKDEYRKVEHLIKATIWEGER